MAKNRIRSAKSSTVPPPWSLPHGILFDGPKRPSDSFQCARSNWNISCYEREFMMNRSGFYEQRAPFREKEAKRGYHSFLKKYYQFLIPAGMRVLELGCGLGDLLAAGKPSAGFGGGFQSSDNHTGPKAAS